MEKAHPVQALKVRKSTTQLVYISLSIAFVSLLIAGYALLVASSSSLPGKGMGAYDFSTPEDSVKSFMLIEANNDLMARFELASKLNSAEREETIDAINNLVVDRVIEHEDKRLVLYKIRIGGLDEYKTQWLEENDGVFINSFVSTWDWDEGSSREKQIHQLITQWEKRGENFGEAE